MAKEDVLKAMAGDAQSFYKIVEERKSSTYRVAYSYTRNAEDALDVVQEAVYKAYISLTKLKNPEYFNTWFYRITVNCAIDFMKKQSKVSTVSDEDLQHIAVYNENKDDSIDLEKALQTLDEKYKTVIVLRFFEELSLEEIAKVLDVSVNTVKSRLYRGLEKLKIELKEVGIFNGR